MRARLLLVLLAAAIVVGVANESLAGGHRRAACQAAGSGWAGGYYHVMWGEPVALVVPPTAAYQTHWSWGVAQTSITPIWPQFGRAYPGPVVPSRGYLPTPPWPSSTDQFGVYYVRGPW